MLSFALAVMVAGGAQSPWRLPDTIVPVHHRISLDLDVPGERFSGDETIEVTVSAPTREIVLHSLGLEIASATVRQAGTSMELEVSIDEAHERVVLRAPRALDAGAASLDLAFSGPLKEGLRGLYLSRSGDDVYAATQMQATYARMMFPCFDEPSFKATFSLDVVVAAGATAISNGPLLSEEPTANGRTRVTFGRSPVMSTYLVALAVGTYDCLTETIAGIPVRVCGRTGKKRELEFAMDVTRKTLRWFNEWYGIPYPFGKLDLVAVPDYEWGGMENTAAIYFREVYLLVDPETSSPARRQRVAALVAHEIAHQWFGDLVTTAWWDDIWLNEGFATWMAPKAVAEFDPSWKWDEEQVADAQSVMALDSLRATRPIHGTAATPDEIKEMFDGIAYTKGAAIVRMLEAWVGEETFRKGVNAYLEAHANGNARSEDLWKAVANVSGRSVDAIMPTFVLQPGVPVVDFDAREDEAGWSLVLSQKRFLSAGGEGAERWKVPVCLRAGLEDGTVTEVCALLEGKETLVRVPSRLKWFVGNVDGKGYYRVGWTGEQLLALREVVPSLSPAERLSILADAWAMTESGSSGIDSFLDLASSYRGERNRIVLDALAQAVGKVRRTLVGDAGREAFDAWSRDLVRELAGELGISPSATDDDARRALRAAVVTILAEAGDEEVLESLRATLHASLEDPASGDPSLVEVAFGIVPAGGDAAMFAKLASTLAATTSGQTYDLCLTGLTRFRDQAIVDRVIRFPESGNVRLDRYPSFFEALLENPAAREKTWSYLEANWPDLKTKVVSFGGRGAMRAIGSFCTPALVNDARAFFAKNDVPGAERALAISLEQAEACILFKKSQAERFETWMNERRTAGMQNE